MPARPIKLACASLLLPAAVMLSVQAGAQEPAEPASLDALLASGHVPTELLGVPCKESPNADPELPLFRRCAADRMLEQPSTTFSVADWSEAPSTERLADLSREPFHERVMMDAIEEPFVPPSQPGAIGLRAFYRTDLGNRYVWSVYHEGKLTRVIVMVLSRVDPPALVAEIEQKIFGVAPASRRGQS